MGKGKTETQGQRIQRLRHEAGLSQSQLAERAGMPLSSLKNLEQDHRPNPQWATMLALAKAIGVSLDVLAGWK